MYEPKRHTLQQNALQKPVWIPLGELPGVLLPYAGGVAPGPREVQRSEAQAAEPRGKAVQRVACQAEPPEARHVPERSGDLRQRPPPPLLASNTSLPGCFQILPVWMCRRTPLPPTEAKPCAHPIPLLQTRCASTPTGCTTLNLDWLMLSSGKYHFLQQEKPALSMVSRGSAKGIPKTKLGSRRVRGNTQLPV